MSGVFLFVMVLMGQSAYAMSPQYGTASETNYARNLYPPKGKSLVYIYMRNQDANVISPRIWLNNYEIGRLMPGSFTVWQLAPGQLNLRVDKSHSASITVRSAAGRVYLFRISARQTSAGRKQAEIESLPESYRGDLAATRLIKNPRQVTVAVAPQTAEPEQKQIVTQTSAQETMNPTPKHKQTHKVKTALKPGGYVVMLKLGNFSVKNRTQSIDDLSGTTYDLNYDKSASGVFGVEFNKELESGFAWGGELIRYKTNFTTSVGAGDVSAIVGLANAKQYFRTDSNLQPYLGIGAGYAIAKVSGSLSDDTAGFAYQLVGGLEYRTDNLGFFAEAKYLGAKTKDKNSQTFDITGNGIFAGLALHF